MKNIFFRKPRLKIDRDPKLRIDFKIVMPKQKQNTYRKKFFSRNTHPHYYIHQVVIVFEHFYLTVNTKSIVCVCPEGKHIPQAHLR